jgi:hypothetical protein
MQLNILMLIAGVSLIPVVDPETPPKPDHSQVIPQGYVTAIDSTEAVPKGWVECSKTHANKKCENLAKRFLEESPTSKVAPKYIVRLPDDGTVDDLNKFLDAAAASLNGIPK